MIWLLAVEKILYHQKRDKMNAGGQKVNLRLKGELGAEKNIALAIKFLRLTVLCKLDAVSLHTK